MRLKMKILVVGVLCMTKGDKQGCTSSKSTSCITSEHLLTLTFVSITKQTLGFKIYIGLLSTQANALTTYNNRSDQHHMLCF